MIRFFLKYGIAIFIVNTILLSIVSTISLGNIVFLTLMIGSAIIFLINPQQIKNIIFHKAFFFLLSINILNICYFLLFHSVNDIKAVQYLLARGMQFAMISVAIFLNYDYFKIKFLDHLAYCILFIVFFGLFFSPDIFSGRYSGLVWNPNMLSSFTVIAFGVLLLKDQKSSYYDYLFLILLFSVALATGSRGSLVGIVLSFLLKYGFSKSNISFGFFALVGYFTLINIDLDTSVNRFASQELFSDRLLQFRYAYETLLLKPYFGFGLDKYAYINPEVIPFHLRNIIIGAHNGYLAILTQYGLVFGSTVLFVIFHKSIELISYFKQSIKIERSYVFIIIYGLFASAYETLITGINEFHTILFWFSLSFLSYSKFRHES